MGPAISVGVVGNVLNASSRGMSRIKNNSDSTAVVAAIVPYEAKILPPPRLERGPLAEDTESDLDEIEVCREARLAAVEHILMASGFLRRVDPALGEKLMTDAIQYAYINGISSIDTDEVVSRRLKGRRSRLWRTGRISKSQKMPQDSETGNGRVVDNRVRHANASACLRDQSECSRELVTGMASVYPTQLPCSPELLDFHSFKVSKMEIEFEEARSPDISALVESLNVPEEVPNSAYFPESACPIMICAAHRSCDGQDEVAITSGEALNPGPKIKGGKIASAVKKAVKKMKPNKKLGASSSRKLKSKAVAPMQAGFKGKGDYVEDIGSFLGKKAAGLFKNVFGLGDYQTGDKPGANSMVAGTSPPVISNDKKDHSFIFRHREYITDVQSSQNFVNTVYQLNPGQYKTFPWLAPLAAAFEEWKPMGMLFEFKSLTSPLAANSSGSVTFATEYNPTKAAFTSKTQAENSEFATSCRPCDSMLHAIECLTAESPVNVFQVRLGGVPSGQDVRFYDLCNFQVITQGQTNTPSAIGELWATYEIAFFKPLFNTGLGLNLLSDKWALTGCVTATLLGTSQVQQAGSLIGTTINAGGNTITWPSNITTGEYLIAINWQAGSNVCGAGTFTLTPANCSVLNVWRSHTTPANADVDAYATVNAGVGALGAGYLLILVSVNAPGATQAGLNITAGTYTITSAAYADMLITQINGNILT